MERLKTAIIRTGATMLLVVELLLYAIFGWLIHPIIGIIAFAFFDIVNKKRFCFKKYLSVIDAIMRAYPQIIITILKTIKITLKPVVTDDDVNKLKKQIKNYSDEIVDDYDWKNL